MSNLSKLLSFSLIRSEKNPIKLKNIQVYRRNVEGHTFNVSKKDLKETWLICNIQKLVVNHKNYCILVKL